MPAPDFVRLLDFKTQFEQAAYQLLNTVGIAPYMPGNEEQQLPRTTVQVMFQRGGATGLMGLLPDGLNQEYSEFLGMLVIENTVDYLIDQENQEPYLDRDHARFVDELVAKEAALFLEHTRPFATTDTLLPWLDVLTIVPQDPDERPEHEREVNVFRLRWQVKFCIRSDAWPVPTP
ncbi:MAG TPA: hypothetical protein VHF69_11640 [Candidatus Synoicihabitans sp.]|nr:hypothetical protein [Candidatus Synoicihabitans sp.]